MISNICEGFNKPSERVKEIKEDKKNLFKKIEDFKMAKENPNAVILNSRDEIKNKDINKVLIDYKVPKSSRGVYYNINSEESKKIAKSYEIQKFIDENYDDLQNSNCKKDSPLAFNENTDKDLYLAFQHFRLLNPKITPDGYFEATVIDYYDFKYRNIEKADSHKKITAKNLNNWGYSMQEKGRIENLFIIYRIRKKLW